MEVEAKLIVPDRAVFERLARADSLAGWPLGPRRMLVQADTYLDTEDGSLFAAGWACRLRRRQGETSLLTLKALPDRQGTVLRREERETAVVNEGLDPFQWPAGPVREAILTVAGGSPLVPVLRLRQRRTLRAVLTPPSPGEGSSGPSERSLASLSLDDVRVEESADLAVALRAAAVDDPSGARPQSWLEVEIELAAGDEELLASLTGVLTREWGCRPDARSKLERALGWS